MKWFLFQQPLGMSDVSGGFAPRKKAALPLAVPLALGAASVVSSWWGANQSKKANEQAERELAEQRARVEAERRRRMNEDYLDTAAGQNLLRVAREERDKIWRREAGAAAVAGGTDAAAAMAKEAGNKMIGDTVAGIAAQDTARKDNIDASYRADEARLTQQEIAAKRAQGEAIAGAASGASSALMNGALATFGGTKLGQEMLSPGGGGVGAPAGAPASTVTTPVVGAAPTQLDMLGRQMVPQISSWNYTNMMKYLNANRYHL